MVFPAEGEIRFLGTLGTSADEYFISPSNLFAWTGIAPGMDARRAETLPSITPQACTTARAGTAARFTTARPAPARGQPLTYRPLRVFRAFSGMPPFASGSAIGGEASCCWASDLPGMG